MDKIEIDKVIKQCKKSIIKSSIRVTIDVVIELLCLVGFILTLLDESDIVPFYYFVLPFIYLVVVYLRIWLLIRGIRFCKYIKFGEILYANVIFLQILPAIKTPSKARIQYEYVYRGNKYVDKDTCWYRERDFMKLDFDEQVMHPDNAQIPIVIYKQKSLVFFQCIGPLVLRRCRE